MAVAISGSSCCEDEQIAAVLSDGSVALFKSVEEDLWEETLEVWREGRQEGEWVEREKR